MPEILSNCPLWAQNLKVGTRLKITPVYKNQFILFVITECIPVAQFGVPLYSIKSYSIGGTIDEHSFVSAKTISEYCLDPKPETLNIEGDYYQ